MFRDDGYRAPKLAVVFILLVMVAAGLYIFLASRQLAKAGSDSGPTPSAHVRRVEKAIEDTREAMAGRRPKQSRIR